MWIMNEACFFWKTRCAGYHNWLLLPCLIGGEEVITSAILNILNRRINRMDTCNVILEIYQDRQ